MASGRLKQAAEKARFFLSVCILTLLMSCSERAAHVTDPFASANQPGEVANRVDIDFGGKLGGEIGQCLTATRAVDGRFFGRSTKMHFPSRFMNSATTRLAFRGWSAGEFEPIVITVCTVPLDPEAVELASKRFGGRRMSDSALRDFAVVLGVPQSAEWKKGNRPSLAVNPSSIIVIDGRSPQSASGTFSESGAVSGIYSAPDCEDPYFISTDCPAIPIDDSVYDTSPDDPFASLETPPLSDGVITCWANAQYPHRSTFMGTVNGNINAKASSECTEEIALIAVQSQLWRYRCIWWFCAWTPVSFSLPLAMPLSYRVVQPATSNCVWSDGWYQTRGFHSFTVITASFPSVPNMEPRYALVIGANQVLEAI